MLSLFVGCLVAVDLLLDGVGGSELTDAPAGEPLAHVDAGLKGLALDETTEETAGESITNEVLAKDRRLGVLRGRAYPAPLVSTISDSAMAWTGKVLTSLLSEKATTVGSVP
jgi:hypothetical protein